MILAVDPGVSASNAAGVALLDPRSRRVIAADIVRPARGLSGLAAQDAVAKLVVAWALFASARTLSAFVTEWPQVYPHERKVNPNTSLLPLCGLIGNLSGRLSGLLQITYTPREWKGTVKGDAFLERILERLDPLERSIVDQVMPAGLRHNSVDAIGLGLFYLGRMGRSRAIHNEAAQAVS